MMRAAPSNGCSKERALQLHRATLVSTSQSLTPVQDLSVVYSFTVEQDPPSHDPATRNPHACSFARSRSTTRPRCRPSFPRWEIVQFLATQVPWPYPDDGALDLLPRYRAARRFSRRRVALDVATEAGTGPDHRRHLARQGDVNRGFWLGTPWQGRGLMREAADSSPPSGSTNLDSPSCVSPRQSPTTPPAASRRSRACAS